MHAHIFNLSAARTANWIQALTLDGSISTTCLLNLLIYSCPFTQKYVVYMEDDMVIALLRNMQEHALVELLNLSPYRQN
jgi:hypothetical protein